MLQTPQSEQAEPLQVVNSAGGYVFELSIWDRLDRWLILGAEGGTYYATEQKLTRENAKTITECLAADGARAVSRITEISDSGRAPKNDPAIFALAIAAADPNEQTRAAALAAIPKVCRTATHLFQFAESVQAMRGWGRGLRRAIGSWYTSKTPEQLCYQVTKYGQRNGWSHRDLLRLAHVPHPAELAPVFRYVTSGADGLGERTLANGRTYPSAGELPAYLAAFEELKAADERRTIDLIREHRFTHEMIATEHKNSAAVWEALLETMPMTAMVRNLAKMTEVGLLKPMSAAVATVCARLGDAERIKKARLHPIAALSALKVHQSGKGVLGSLTWSPVPQIVDALDGAFYSAFDSIEPTGKRTLLAVDVSGSMDGNNVSGVPGLTSRAAAAAMAMVTARAEKNWHVVGFSHQLVDIPISPRQRLDDIIQTMSRISFGRTDCALPMVHAKAAKLDVDVFHVYTDNETWCGAIHPHQALNQYRKASGINAKSAVVAFTATPFTIANPNDAGMMDFVGFDSAAPNLLADFARSGS